MKTTNLLSDHLDYLQLGHIQQHHRELAQEAARAQWSHGDYLARLVEGEVLERSQRAQERRIKLARFPFVKTLEQYQWSWPKKINQMAMRQLFKLEFLRDHANVVFMGSVGLGKTHLAVALGQAACVAGHRVLYAPAVKVINDLTQAQALHRLKRELAKYVEIDVLILDELGYLPIDKTGADLLFQVLAGRYERRSTILTTNRAYKQWPEIFNHDAMLTAALLDRLVHHVETVVIEGRSYRTKERIEEP